MLAAASWQQVTDDGEIPAFDEAQVEQQAQTPAEILAPKTIPPGELERCAELGAALAAGLALGIF